LQILAAFFIIIIIIILFANVKHRQQQVTDAIVAGQQGSVIKRLQTFFIFSTFFTFFNVFLFLSERLLHLCFLWPTVYIYNLK